MLKSRQLELSLTYAEKSLHGYVTSPPEWPKEEVGVTNTILKLLQETDSLQSGKDGSTGIKIELPDFKTVLEQCSLARKDANK